MSPTRSPERSLPNWRPWLLVAVLLLVGCGGEEEPAREFGRLDLLQRLTETFVVPDVVDPGHEACQALLGEGWYPPERTKAKGGYAWTYLTDATLSLPVHEPGAGTLVLRGYGVAAPREHRRLEILVNGSSLGTRNLPTSIDTTVWDVPAGALRRGLNDVVLRVDRAVSPRELGQSADIRPLGVLVDWLAYASAGGQVTGSAYDEPPSLELRPDRWLAVRLEHGAGSMVVLDWTEGAPPPRILTAPLPGVSTGFTARATPSDTGGGQVVLPPDLAGGSWLMISGDGGRLTRAELHAPGRELDVVLIIVDTLRPDYLGCYGGTRVATPAVDGLAADGVLFEVASSHIPITGPSHASLFTSRLPSETGLVNNARGHLPRTLPTLAEILAERGWSAGAAVSIATIDGRWGFGRGFTPYDDRFGEFSILRADTMAPRIDAVRRGLGRPGFLLAHLADPHEPYDAHGLVDRRAEVLVGGQVLVEIPTSTFTPTLLPLQVAAGQTEVVLRSSHPFHVFELGLRGGEGVEIELVGGGAPDTSHTGIIRAEGSAAVDLAVYIADQVENEQKLRPRYAREVAFADRHVGALLDSLRAVGTYDDALVIFTSDHGESLGEHGWIGHIRTLYDVMTRVPLIIKPPRDAGVPGGQRRTDQAALVDLLPTVLAAVGAPPLPGARGRDLLAEGAARRETAVFLETHRPEAERDLYGLRTDRGKIIHEPATGAWEYYDLAADPNELEDIFAAGGAEVERHRNLLLAALARLNLGDVDFEAVEMDARTAEMLKSLGY